MTDTMKFTVPSDDKENMRRILRTTNTKTDLPLTFGKYHTVRADAAR